MTCRAASRRRRRLCARAYLPAGRRNGRYWIAGDVQGTKGKSLFVKLFGDGAGRWTDAASGDYGDLLDLIRLNKGLNDVPKPLTRRAISCATPGPSATAASRLSKRPLPASRRAIPWPPPRSCTASPARVPHTLAETYLRGRAITANLYLPALRFHPTCYYRPDDGGPRQSWPTLLGVVTDVDGNLTGLQRTWLARDGGGKAPLPDPRRAMGQILGNAVRFGAPKDIIAAGEGIETVLSLLSPLSGLAHGRRPLRRPSCRPPVPSRPFPSLRASR